MATDIPVNKILVGIAFVVASLIGLGTYAGYRSWTSGKEYYSKFKTESTELKIFAESFKPKDRSKTCSKFGEDKSLECVTALSQKFVTKHGKLTPIGAAFMLTAGTNAFSTTQRKPAGVELSFKEQESELARMMDVFEWFLYSSENFVLDQKPSLFSLAVTDHFDRFAYSRMADVMYQVNDKYWRALSGVHDKMLSSSTQDMDADLCKRVYEVEQRYKKVKAQLKVEKNPGLIGRLLASRSKHGPQLQKHLEKLESGGF